MKIMTDTWLDINAIPARGNLKENIAKSDLKITVNLRSFKLHSFFFVFFFIFLIFCIFFSFWGCRHKKKLRRKNKKKRVRKDYELPLDPTCVWHFFWSLMLHGAAANGETKHENMILFYFFCFVFFVLVFGV